MIQLRNERAGLTMIFASLAVIGVTIFLLFSYQLDSQETRIRAQGVGLARLLGGISWEQLIINDGRQGPLQIIRQSQNDPAFAYGVVVDTQGRPKSSVTAPGVIIPAVTLPDEPSSWLDEQTIQSKDKDSTYLEFHAPLFSGKELSGYIRLGYSMPRFGLSYDKVPFMATMALPIFLLVPLFYFLLRKEIRPLLRVNQKVEQAMSEGGFSKVEINAGGELGEFLERFNGFIEMSRSRINELEQDQQGLVTSTKLISYRQSRVEAVLQTMPDAVIVLDSTGIVSYANAKLTGLLGIDPADVLHRKPGEWCNNAETVAFLSRFQGAQGTGRRSAPHRFHPDNDDGRTVEVNSYPLFSPKDDSDLLGTLIVFRDITEEDLAKRSRGEFVAQVAHELKTPLNVMAMYSESLLGEEGDDRVFRIEAVNVIHDEVERLSNLINNLLAITRFELGGIHINRQRVRLHELLEDAFNNVTKNSARDDLEFQLDLPREMSSVNLDKDLLRIAINNLLTNAIKYNLPNGKVSLSAEEMDDAVEIVVSDSGIGIKPEEQEKVFNKFYRSEDQNVREQTGHGLGLSLVKQIIQMHKGRLSVESEPGNGSRFVIRLDKGMMLLKQVA